MKLKIISLITISLIVIYFIGCSSNEINPVQNIKALSILEDKNIDIKNLTTPIMLLGDTQEHEDFGEPTFSGTKWVDTYITDVTRRTAQANLNEIEILKAILKNNQEKPVIHMGDFLDVSCHDEFTRAINVLSQHDKWIVMLGNHDGYYVGNFLKQNISGRWAKQCDSGRFYEDLKLRDIDKSDNFENALDHEIAQYDDENKTIHVRSYNKSTVIERYLSTLFRKNREVNRSVYSNYSKIFDENNSFIDTNATFKDFNYTSVSSIMDNHEGNRRERVVEYRNSDSNAFIKNIYAYINQCKIKSDLSSCNPQESFLLQKVSLKENEIELILLDTSVYKTPYSDWLLSPMYHEKDLAGNKGNLTSDSDKLIGINQLEIVKKWIKHNNKKNITTIFAGHHPLSKVSELQDFFKQDIFEDKPIFYISAHTHQGFWRKHKGDNKNVTELNIGSLIDFPVHYRTLQVERIDNSELKVFSKLKDINLFNVQLLTGYSCQSEWFNYSLYPYCKPSWQENGNKYNMNIWNSKHLSLLPYLSYYLKLLKMDNLKGDLDISFQILDNNLTQNTKTRTELISYLEHSILNFEKKFDADRINVIVDRLKVKNSILEKIDNNNSCIKYYKKNKTLSTRDCSNLLYKLKKEENEIFKDFNQSLLSTYKICTALNAIEVDAKTSEAKVLEDEIEEDDLNNKDYRRCSTLYDCRQFEFENRKIEKIIVK